jgi:hypothetical protein
VPFKLTISLASLFVTCSALAAPGKQARAAKPEHQRRYAVSDLTIDGSVSDEDRKKIETRLPGVVAILLGNQNADVATEGELRSVLDAHAELRNCNTDRCYLRLGDLLHADRLLSIRVERVEEPPSGWKWLVHILNYAVDQAQIVGTAVVPCIQCKADDMVNDVSNSFQPVFNGDTPKPLCTLSVGSRPPGATVSIDQIPLGETPFQHTIAAGRHTISVEHERFAKGQAESDCKANQGLDIAFTLDAKQTTSAVKDVELSELHGTGDHHLLPPPHVSNGLRIAGGTLLGVGIAGVITGGILVSFDGKGTCSLVGNHLQCPDHYATATPGYVAIGLGAGALIGGIVALVVDHKHRERARAGRDIRPSVQTSSRSLQFGLEGRF